MRNGLSGIINSYTQVFFSKNIVFAIILFIVTFFDLYAGLAGLLAVIFTNLAATIIGLNTEKVREGVYGFNSLLVGLGIGIYYQPGVEFYIVLFFISLLTLFFSVGLEGVLGKYGLPFLSIPFLFGIWMVIIASTGYSALDISERGIYNLNDMYAIGGFAMVNLYDWFNNLQVPESLRIYFKSLSAILFQYHMFAGLLIAIGLLFYSRIAFLLSLIGFYAAYYFYQFIGADISELSYSYIGFNYILTAIAAGGFFIVPSRYSILSVVILTPLVAITLSSTAYLFSFVHLSVFSLPFNIVVILFLYVIKFRERNIERLAPVTFQQYSPEKHAYSQKNYMLRFGNLPWIAMKLPFWGEWKVTQAHNGEYTHKGDWKHAWDFEIADEEGKVYDGTGTTLKDYYCYNKPVASPADGIIETVEDGIDDNLIGDMNLEKNWGNSVVIEHAEKLYSQISHLKKDSITVAVGQPVKQGEVIGYCGNSGRSPIPHIHFQFQEAPSIGSKTVDYPVSSYFIQKDNKHTFKTSDKPVLDEKVSNIQNNELVQNAYHFVPGETIRFETNEQGKEDQHEWEVKSDIYNNTFFECRQSSAKVWFKDLGDVFYFTHYEGRKNTLLYYFYLSSFKVVKAFYPDLVVHDKYPLTSYPNRKALILQDFCIPFFKFLKTSYQLNFTKASDQSSKEIILHTKARFGKADNGVNSIDFIINITEEGISRIDIKKDKTKITAIRIK